MKTYFHSQLILLKQNFSNKKQVLRKINDLFLTHNLMQEDCYQELLERDHSGGTYLDHGLVIPHCSHPFKSEKSTKKVKNAIVVIQLKNPFIWNGQLVKMAWGLTTHPKSHLAFLRKVSNLVSNQKLIENLSETNDVEIFLDTFRVYFPPPQQKNTDQTEKTLSKSRLNLKTFTKEFDKVDSVILPAMIDLHARPALILVEQAKKYDSEIFFATKDRVANAKSLVEILQLAAENGEKLYILAKGSDAHVALQGMLLTFNKIFLGNLSLASSISLNNPKTLIASNKNIVFYKNYQGKISKGKIIHHSFNHPNPPDMIVATPFFYSPHSLKKKPLPSNRFSTTQEIKSLDLALKNLNKHLHELIKTSDQENSLIFKTHLEVVGDISLINKIKEMINEKKIPAQQAVSSVFKSSLTSLLHSGKEIFYQRVQDLKDIENQLLNLLADENYYKKEAVFPDIPFVLLAQNLWPSEAQKLFSPKIRKNLQGVILSSKSEHSHVSIILGALNLPIMIDFPGQSMIQIKKQAAKNPSSKIIIDIERQQVIHSPDQEDLENARKINVIGGQENNLQKKISKVSSEENLKEKKDKPERSKNIPNSIKLWTNINSLSELEDINHHNIEVEGVGLLRTEMIFSSWTSFPSLQEQIGIYEYIAKKMYPRPIVIRSLDIANDKILKYLSSYKKSQRTISSHDFKNHKRFKDFNRLEKKFVFEQLQAINEVGQKYQNIKILFPMVVTVEDFFDYYQIFLEIQKNYLLKQKNKTEKPSKFFKIPLGVMIETPSIIRQLNFLKKYVDFFSIGSNDLEHFSLLESGGSSHHEIQDSLLLMIQEIIHRCDKIPVTICGNHPTNFNNLALLIGLGIKNFSLPVSKIKQTETVLSKLNYRKCFKLVKNKMNLYN